MAREPQRANGSGSLAQLNMSNGPGRYDPNKSAFEVWLSIIESRTTNVE